MEGVDWLDQMSGYLNWHVYGPDMSNPYKSPPPPATLRRMLEDPAFFSANLCMRCTCEGHEILVIADPSKPRVQSNHPCVSEITKQEVLEYIDRSGLVKLIASETEKIRKELESFLETLDKKSKKKR